MHDIDCHIILHGEPKWEVDRCMASFDGQAVNVHLVQGEDNDFPPYIGRAKGYAMGSAPYVCFADPDDWIEPNAFELLNAHLGESDVLFGWELVWRDGKVIDIATAPHHLFVVGRFLGLDLSGGFRALNTRQLSEKCIPAALYNWDITGGRYG